MKSYLQSMTVFTVFFLLFQQLSSAQKKQVDCYNLYKQKGDSYKNSRNYDLAIQQYQSAKYCNSLNYNQRRTLDSLIADINRRRPKIMERKY